MLFVTFSLIQVVCFCFSFPIIMILRDNGMFLSATMLISASQTEGRNIGTATQHPFSSLDDNDWVSHGLIKNLVVIGRCCTGKTTFRSHVSKYKTTSQQVNIVPEVNQKPSNEQEYSSC